MNELEEGHLRYNFVLSRKLVITGMSQVFDIFCQRSNIAVENDPSMIRPSQPPVVISSVKGVYVMHCSKEVASHGSMLG